MSTPSSGSSTPSSTETLVTSLDMLPFYMGERVEHHHHNHAEQGQNFDSHQWNKNMDLLTAAKRFDDQTACGHINALIAQMKEPTQTRPTLAEMSRFYTQLVELIKKASEKLPKSGVLIQKCLRILWGLCKEDFTKCPDCQQMRSGAMAQAIPNLCVFLEKFRDCFQKFVLTNLEDSKMSGEFPNFICFSFGLLNSLVDGEQYRRQMFTKGLPSIMASYKIIPTTVINPITELIRQLTRESISSEGVFKRQFELDKKQDDQLFNCVLTYVQALAPPLERHGPYLVALLETLPPFFEGAPTRINDFLKIRSVRAMLVLLQGDATLRTRPAIERFLKLVNTRLGEKDLK